MASDSRRLRDIAAHLRTIASKVERADDNELPAGVGVFVLLVVNSTPDGIAKETVDAIARVTGNSAAFEDSRTGAKYGTYKTTLESEQGWELSASAFIRRPETDLEAENARLRAELAELQAAREVAHA